jgi:uncharacterized protein
MVTQTATTPLGITLPTGNELAAFCLRWEVRELALFGCVLRPDFSADSDVDMLATLAPDAHPGMVDWERMREQLSVLLGRRVDLLNRASLEVSKGARRKREILDSARVIHVAGR